jgi:hypothetical protein
MGQQQRSKCAFILQMRLIQMKIMKYIYQYSTLLFLIAAIFSFVNHESKTLHSSFGAGERLIYRVHYGLINAGEAKIEVSDKLFFVNDKVCYKAVCSGRSTGAFDLMLKIRDTWGSYIDTVSYSPQKGYRDIQEGKYKLKEATYFDLKNNAVTVDRETDKKSSAVFKITQDVQDIVSGFYNIRNVNYNNMKIGDTIGVHTFLEDKMYDFKVKYLGKGTVDCKFGDIKCIKLSPIMEKNGLFENGNSIRFWLSDDKNKIPVRIEADMFVGQVAMDLKEFQGLRYPIEFK